MAGELEIIANHCGLAQEREGRTQLAKMLCYHKKYLEDEDLQEGYDSILKQIEQGTLQWGKIWERDYIHYWTTEPM